MIYPKEGSALNSNPAGIVDAPWVTGEERDAARDVGRLPARGRPATAVHGRGLPAGNRPISPRRSDQFAEVGPRPDRAADRTIDPGELDPAVLPRSWTRGAR